MAQPKVRLVTYAWGRDYIDELLDYALASVLSPGNLPALARAFDCTVVVVTEEELFEYVRNSPTSRALQQICKLKLAPLDDLISQPWQYGMTLTYALYRGFEDLGPAMTETYILFLNSDFVLADGCYERLIPRICSDERAHLSPSYCAVAERVEPVLSARSDGAILSIPPRDMAALILDNCHNTILSKTINQSLLEFEHTDQFYWRVDARTLVGRQMPIALVGMRPERYVASLSTFWDWGIVYEFCPSRRLASIGDSDEFLMMELRPENRSLESVRLGHSRPKDIARRMRGYITQYQLDNAQFPLVLHSGDIPDLAAAERSLRSHIDAVLANLPSAPINHRNHAQWLYHKAHFRERLEIKARRLAPLRLRRGSAPATVHDIHFAPTWRARLARRIGQMAHPYKARNGNIRKHLRELGDGGEPVLICCEIDSYLLDATAKLPGLVTHLTPASALQQALSLWPSSTPKFDTCVIELSPASAASTADILEVCLPHLKPDAKILFLWNDRSNLPLQAAVPQIMKIITARRLEFAFHYTKAPASAVIARLLRQMSRPRGTRLRRIAYPLALLSLAAAGALATAVALRERILPTRRAPTAGETSNGLLVSIQLRPEARPLAPAAPASPGKQRAHRLATPRIVDLYFNKSPDFTVWLAASDALQEPFVVVDVGVLGGENPRWHFLADHLVVHGFDPISEAIDELRATNTEPLRRKYHKIGIGREDSERRFYVDPAQPTNSSFVETANAVREVRNVRVRSLDSLLAEGVIGQADFLKIDVEGFERDVLLGARTTLARGVLGAEVETNFNVSPEYPDSHFGFVHGEMLKSGLRVADLNFDRDVRPAYAAARIRHGAPAHGGVNAGMPSTFNMLFARDPSRGEPGGGLLPSLSVDQLLKLMVIYELHGLNDVAVDIAAKFSQRLKSRIDVEHAIGLLSVR